MNRQPFLTHCFSLVICRHNFSKKFLCVKETRNRGWWVAGGLVNPGEDFYTAAVRETKEEAGVEINIKGVLRVEHTVYGHQTARMRVIFYAESDTDTPKQVSDEESEGAAWFSIEEIKNLQKTKPGLRGPEIIEWPIYIENGGLISPTRILVDEDFEILKEGYQKDQIFSVAKKESISIDSNSPTLNLFKKALENEDTLYISEILRSGFNPNVAINQKNWTPLHYAIKTKNEKLVKILLLSDAKTDLLTHKKRNSFHFAMQSSFQILKMLILSISDFPEENQYEILNFQDDFGDTPLHILSRDLIKYDSHDFSIFEFLVKNGADPNIKNQEGISPFEYISELNKKI